MDTILHILGRQPCMMQKLTGLYCPGCGGTRAVRALLAGHPLQSFFVPSLRSLRSCPDGNPNFFPTGGEGEQGKDQASFLQAGVALDWCPSHCRKLDSEKYPAACLSYSYRIEASNWISCMESGSKDINKMAITAIRLRIRPSTEKRSPGPYCPFPGFPLREEPGQFQVRRRKKKCRSRERGWR